MIIKKRGSHFIELDHLVVGSSFGSFFWRKNTETLRLVLIALSLFSFYCFSFGGLDFSIGLC